MLNFSKTKILAISLACLLFVFFALPSFLINSTNVNLVKLQKFLPSNKVNLGLDLKGGSQLLIEVDYKNYIDEQISLLRNELKNEFYNKSVRALPEKVGEKIVFNISEISKVSEIKKIIRDINNKAQIKESEGKFEIYFTEEELKNIRSNLVKQSIEIVRRRIDENGTKEPTIIAEGENRILLQVPGIENSEELKNILGKTAKMTFHFAAENDSSSSLTNPQFTRSFDKSGNIYLINKEVILNGEMLVDARPTYHEGKPAVAFRFNNLGSRKFAEITKNNIGRVFAIVLDGKVITAPVINTAINQGNGIISGSFTSQEANEVALLLRAGALPAPLKIIEERTVGPSLGSDSIYSGKVSALAGLILVAIFMIVFYGLFGLIADLAMFVNIGIIITVLSIFDATLTLPGIAGIVLTMGMSVDANVLIFERIKEELRNKKSVYASVEQGFSQAYRTIIDSNLTTLITAFFLYAFGNGSVRGFAVTLSIGIMSSMFSAILLTRMLISIWLKRTKPKKLSLI